MHRLHLPAVLTTLLAATALVPAQSFPFANAYVLCANATTIPTAVLEVDFATGAHTALPMFPSNLLPPLAIEYDPIDGSLLIALQSGTSTQIMRRRWRPVVIETVLGTVPGHAVELLLDRFGDVVVATGGSAGGLYRLPRLGGSATLIRAVPNLTAAGAPQRLHYNAILGISGTTAPAQDPAVGDVDLESAAWNWGPHPFLNFTPHGIVGLIDLPTGVPRQVLAHDDGTMSVYSWAMPGVPLVLATQPTLPAGGITAMKAHDAFLGLVLGGNANPYLYSFDPYSALGLTVLLNTRAGPFPGTPIDYTVVRPEGVDLLTFGRPCGAIAELHIGTLSGPGPALGNQQFGLTLWQGAPSAPAWLALGFEEVAVPLPNGCTLTLLPTAIAGRTTDTAGTADLAIPIPSAPALIGVRFFGQWLQVDGSLPFATSDVIALTIG